MFKVLGQRRVILLGSVLGWVHGGAVVWPCSCIAALCARAAGRWWSAGGLGSGSGRQGSTRHALRRSGGSCRAGNIGHQRVLLASHRWSLHRSLSLGSWCGRLSSSSSLANSFSVSSLVPKIIHCLELEILGCFKPSLSYLATLIRKVFLLGAKTCLQSKHQVTHPTVCRWGKHVRLTLANTSGYLCPDNRVRTKVKLIFYVQCMLRHLHSSQ